MSAINGSTYGLSLSPETSIFLTTFTSLQIVVGSVANFIVIITILVAKQLRNRTEDRLILSLAVADFLAVTTFLPWHCYKLIQGRIQKKLLMFNGLLGVLVLYNGGHAILAIAIDRFIAVAFPLRYKILMRTRNTSIMVAISWGMTIALGVVDVLRLTFILDYNNFKILFFMYDFLLLFAITVLYIIVSYFTLKQSRAILNQRRSVGVQDHISSSRLLLKTTKTTLVFASLYCVTMLSGVIYASYAVTTKISVSSNFANIFWLHSFVFLNSCANPFIYALRTKRFKAAFFSKIWSKMFLQTGPRQDLRQASIP